MAGHGVGDHNRPGGGDRFQRGPAAVGDYDVRGGHHHGHLRQRPEVQRDNLERVHAERADERWTLQQVHHQPR
jgi:hypothetical protein